MLYNSTYNNLYVTFKTLKLKTRETGIKEIEYKLQYTGFRRHHINQLMLNEKLYVVLIDIIS